MTTLIRHDREAALRQFRAVRARSERLAEGLTPEDLTVQSMPDASPGKWHLAHTTWFWDTFLLQPAGRGASPDPAYAVLFNSYYNAVGPQWSRAVRGALSRPTVETVRAWRAAVDENLAALILSASAKDWAKIAPVLELGLNHEEQHQELFCTDLRHALSLNPLSPAAYPALPVTPGPPPAPLRFTPGREGVVAIGAGPDGFAFDNERPRHQALLQPHALADRLVTNAEYQAFIEDGGYETPSLWLAEAWDLIRGENWRRPLYWRETPDGLREFTLHGLEPLDPAAPVNAVSGFEALAFAVWAGARLPTEAEWETAAVADAANQTDAGLYHRPRLTPMREGARRFFGEVWQWTQSPYAPYPGFAASGGALGEYNGKFMINQLVLRGGSCVTPPGHARATYRNFFPPQARWQFAGLRLAKDA